MFSNFAQWFNNLLELAFTKYSSITLQIFLGLIIGAFTLSLQTLTHEIGHAIATILCHFLLKIRQDKDIPSFEWPKIYWKFNTILSKAGDTLGGTTSKLRNFLIGKEKYRKYYFFIVLNGFLFSFLLWVTSLYLSIKYLNYKKYLFLDIVIIIYIIRGTTNFIFSVKNKTSDLAILIQLVKKEIDSG